MSGHAVYDTADAVPVHVNPWTPSRQPFSRSHARPQARRAMSLDNHTSHFGLR
jgi:hypothetical protein